MGSCTIVTGTGENAISVTHLDEPMEHGLIGMVSSPLFKENIAIIIDEDPEANDYSFACLGCGVNGVAPRVMMSEEFYADFKRSSADARVAFFHELGHYVNGDVGNGDMHCDEDRCQLVAENSVSEKELKADKFAVSYFGKDIVVLGLELLKQRILKDYADYDEESVRLATKEIDIRISHIKEMGESK